MKKINVMCMFLWCAQALYSQTVETSPRHLFVSCIKTCTLEFPQMIESVDLGSRDVMAQKVKGMSNMLEVKAAKQEFRGTSMTVITADGKLYPFLVEYAENPSSLDIKVGSTPTLFERIAGEKRSVFGVSTGRLGMRLRLCGVFVDHDVLYYQIQLLNRTDLSFDIDMLRFCIRDKMLLRRTASQEIQQDPLMVYGNTGSVGGQSQQTIVVAFRKFTIPDRKLFIVQVTERNGGRNLELKIRNRNIIRAKMMD